MRQHALGPYPFDPNLVAQGIPLDDRVTFGDQIFAPAEGTPMPPGLGTPPGPPAPEGSPAPSPGNPNEAPSATPSSFNADGVETTPAVDVTQYDPRTGRYAAPDGQVYQQTDLVTGPPKTWEDLILRGDG